MSIRFEQSPAFAPRSHLMVWLAFVVLVASVIATAHQALAVGSSYTFSYNGRLIDTTGRPLEGPVALSVSFYHAAAGGSPALTVTQGLGAVPLQEGVFQISLVLSGSDFHAAFPSVSQAVYIEITDTTNRADAPYDRQLVAIMPYAAKVPVDGSTLEFNSQGELTLKSSAAGGQTTISAINEASSGTIAAARLPALGGDVSGNLNAATVAKLQGRPIAATALNNDEFLKWNGTTWIPSAIVSGAGGTVTSIATGQGLSGGPITASGTIDLNLNTTGGLSKILGAGTNELGIAAGGVTPAMLSITGCSADGKILKISGGVWTCGDDVGLAGGAIVNGDIASGAAIVDTKLAMIATAGKVADTALSDNVSKLGSNIDLASAEVVNTLPVGKGGTGAPTLTGIAVGNGTSAMTSVVGTASQYLRRNAANNAYEFVALGDAATKNTGTGAGELAAGNHGHADAVAGVTAGFMSAADKTTLGGLSSGALLDADFGSQGIMLRGASAGSYSILTDNSSNWNTAYTDRLKWDGVAVGGGTGPEQTAARSTLGLGSMATQASSSVSITGGSISGVAISLMGITDNADATAITIDSSERVGVGTASPSVRLHAASDDAATNTVTDILRLNHSSSGTPATSFGSGLLLSGESDTTDGRDMARIQSIWSTATDASRASKLQFQTLTGAGALATQMTIDGVGNVGIGTTTPTAKLAVVGQIVSILPTTVSPTANAITIDFATSNTQVLDLSTATGLVTATFANAVAGGSYAIQVIQHGTTPRSITWPAAPTVKWPGGVAYVPTQTASALDLVTFFYNGTTFFGTAGKAFQ